MNLRPTAHPPVPQTAADYTRTPSRRCEACRQHGTAVLPATVAGEQTWLCADPGSCRHHWKTP